MIRSHLVALSLSLLMLIQGCTFARPAPIDSEALTTQADSFIAPSTVVITTPLPTATALSAPQISASPEPLPSVYILASTGNLYIRRGPGTVYDRIGLLKKGESAAVIGQDMLSKWVQIEIPDTELTGWVSLLTPFTSLEGDLSQVRAFTFTDWPQPAYIKNCTEHDLLIAPGDVFLYSLWTNSQFLNEIQVDPGAYSFYDTALPDLPLIETVNIVEGETYYVTLNGLGVRHNCP